mmetsp:Transcript_20767/g.34085  ORF Transcript_20767/g.34085 Transcript_20767/m.34085 type:complete len:440 (-) Transcript_20767:165-1484(-)
MLKRSSTLLVLATQIVLLAALQDSLGDRVLESEVPGSHVDDYRNLDLMDQDFNEYLPQKVILNTTNPEAEEFKRLLGHLLSSRCSQPRKLTSILNFGGFGSSLHSTVKPLMWGMKYGYCMDVSFKSFVYGNSTKYFQASFPNNTDAFTPAADTFEKVPDCNLDPDAQTIRATRFNVPLDGEESFVATDEKEKHPCWRELSILGQNSEDFMPKSFYGQPAFFAVSNIITSVFAPSNRMKKKIAVMKKKIGWPTDRKVLGLHVRLGDACTDETQTWRGITCYPLSYFMDKVKEVTRLYGIKDIFLVSESKSTFQETKKYPEFNWISNGAPPAIPENIAIEQALLAKISSPQEVGERWYLEMMLMAESYAMIGKFSSNFFRAALEYNFGSTYTLKPYVGMDSSWCFAYGELHPLIQTVSDEIEMVFQPEGRRIFSDRHKFIC